MGSHVYFLNRLLVIGDGIALCPIRQTCGAKIRVHFPGDTLNKIRIQWTRKKWGISSGEATNNNLCGLKCQESGVLCSLSEKWKMVNVERVLGLTNQKYSCVSLNLRCYQLFIYRTNNLVFSTNKLQGKDMKGNLWIRKLKYQPVAMYGPHLDCNSNFRIHTHFWHL